MIGASEWAYERAARAPFRRAHGMPEIVVTCPARVWADEQGLEHGVDKMALHPLKEATYDAVEALIRRAGRADARASERAPFL